AAQGNGQGDGIAGGRGRHGGLEAIVSLPHDLFAAGLIEITERWSEMNSCVAADVDVRLRPPVPCPPVESPRAVVDEVRAIEIEVLGGVVGNADAAAAPDGDEGSGGVRRVEVATGDGYLSARAKKDSGADEIIILQQDIIPVGPVDIAIAMGDDGDVGDAG